MLACVEKGKEGRKREGKTLNRFLLSASEESLPGSRGGAERSLISKLRVVILDRRCSSLQKFLSARDESEAELPSPSFCLLCKMLFTTA